MYDIVKINLYRPFKNVQVKRFPSMLETVMMNDVLKKLVLFSERRRGKQLNYLNCAKFKFDQMDIIILNKRIANLGKYLCFCFLFAILVNEFDLVHGCYLCWCMFLFFKKERCKVVFASGLAQESRWHSGLCKIGICFPVSHIDGVRCLAMWMQLSICRWLRL